jgi:phosphoribosylamine--glycine ligase
MVLERILVLGAGGREHALAWRLARDPERPEVVVAPGNAGLAESFRCAPVDAADPAAVAALCAAERPDLVVVGPEGPLAAGVVDALEAAGVPVFGPRSAAARLESSKWHAKQVLAAAGVATARAVAFERFEDARAALPGFGPPWVLKADGLAAGKGVRVTCDAAEAEAFLAACLTSGRFGASGRRVVLEAFLAGDEVSVFAVCDGERHVLLPAARDHKRAFDGDAGPNTGGMGAYAPAAHVDAAALATVGERVVTPVLDEMRRRGTPYRGLLYCGLMVDGGVPAVVEFNVRFGDPETQVVVPLVEGSLGALLASAACGRLDPAAARAGAGAAVTVALADAGYPETPAGGGVITGLDEVAGEAGVLVFHAGTARAGDAWRVTGGRAAYVTGLDVDVAAARDRAYAAVDRLGGSGWRCRRDVARTGAARAATAAPRQEG